MNELVALHTQALHEPVASTYLDLLARALAGARLSSAFPDRRRLAASVRALSPEFHGGLYEQVYVDARTGLPNLASFTRIVTDREIARGRSVNDPLAGAGDGSEPLLDRLARKRMYFEKLRGIDPAPLDEHRVQVRRHDPKSGTAMFRLDLTKLDATGVYVRLTVDLTQTSGAWRREVVDLAPGGESARATETFHAQLYRYAAFDAETLLVKLCELEGVTVDRVQRGVVGPALFAIPLDGGAIRPAEPPRDAFKGAFEHWLGLASPAAPQIVLAFQTDLAARDVREEGSNDPLSPLLRSRLAPGELARYDELRRRASFRVYKDRKFVCTAGVRPVVDAVCATAGTKNLIDELR